jgi:hypothetical protein
VLFRSGLPLPFPVSAVEITLRLALNEATVKRQTQGTSYFLLNYPREEDIV